MGGMSCNEMSLIPWHILKKATNFCVSIDDNQVANTVGMLASKSFSTNKIIGGECSTPGIISLISLCNNKKLKNILNLDEKSNILIFGCEGAADKDLYKKLLLKSKKLNDN